MIWLILFIVIFVAIILLFIFYQVGIGPVHIRL